MATHGAEETDGPVDVDPVIVEGLLAGLADGLGELDELDAGKRERRDIWRRSTFRAAK